MLIASTNTGKLKEITNVLASLDLTIEIESLSNHILPEPDEPYDSFEENAMHKARYYGDALQRMTLSDDSGLCIEALDGFPGVRTKEFTVECGSMENAFRELKTRLAGHANLTAEFKTVMALYCPVTKRVLTCGASEKGRLTFDAAGSDGFGFDPIFIPEGYDQPMAKLGLSIKSEISHRAKAVRGLMERYSTEWL